MHDLSTLALMWAGVFVAHFLAIKTRLTSVLWFLAIGSIMANIGLLSSHPSDFIRSFSELGIIFIMFALGFEENASDFVSVIRRSWGIALFGAIAPFSVAYGLTWWYWQDDSTALMCGLAMTATAVSLTMVSLRSEGLHQTPAATGIMASAVLDDIASLIAVAIMVPIAVGHAELSIAALSLIVVKALAFFVLITLLGTLIFPHEYQPRAMPTWAHISLNRFIRIEQGQHATLVVLLTGLLLALLAHVFGFHPAVGAYMAGLIVRKNDFMIAGIDEPDHEAVYRKTQLIVDNIAFSWIGPVFFVSLGTHLVFDAAVVFSVLDKAILLFAALFLAQVASAALAARYTGNFGWQASWMIGFGMLGRAELAFVVLDIAYIQHQLIGVEAFYLLMFVAFMLNVSVPICIRYLKRGYVAELKAERNAG